MKLLKEESGVITIVTLITLAATILLMFATILLLETHRTYLRDTYVAHQALQKLTDTFYEDSALDMAAWVTRFNGIPNAMGIETYQANDANYLTVHFTFDETATPPLSSVLVSQQVTFLDQFMEDYTRPEIGLRTLSATVYMEGRPPPAMAGISRDNSLSMLGPQILDGGGNPTGYRSINTLLEAANLVPTSDRNAFCYPIDIFDGGPAVPLTTDEEYDRCNQRRLMLPGFIASGARARPLGDIGAPPFSYLFAADYSKAPDNKNTEPLYGLTGVSVIPGYGELPPIYYNPLKFYGDDSPTGPRHAENPMLCNINFPFPISSVTQSGVTGSTQALMNSPGVGMLQYNYRESCSGEMSNDPTAVPECRVIRTAADPYMSMLADKGICVTPWHYRVIGGERHWFNRSEMVGVCQSVAAGGEIAIGGCGGQMDYLMWGRNDYQRATSLATQLAILQMSRMASHVYFSIFSGPTQAGNVTETASYIDPGDPTKTNVLVDRIRGDRIIFNPVWENGANIFERPVSVNQHGSVQALTFGGTGPAATLNTGFNYGGGGSFRVYSTIPMLDHAEYPHLNPNPSNPDRPNRSVFAKDHIPTAVQYLGPLEDENHPFPNWPLADRCLSAELPSQEPFRFTVAGSTAPPPLNVTGYRNIGINDSWGGALTGLLYPASGPMEIPDMQGPPVHSFWTTAGTFGNSYNFPPLRNIDPTTFEQTAGSPTIPELKNLATCYDNSDFLPTSGGTDTLGALQNFYETILGYRGLPGMEDSFVNYVLISDGAPNLEGCTEAALDGATGGDPNRFSCNNIPFGTSADPPTGGNPPSLLYLIKQKLDQIEALGNTRVFALVIRQPNDPQGPITLYKDLFNIPPVGTEAPPRMAIQLDVDDVEGFKEDFIKALYLILASFSQEMIITKKGG